MKKNYSSPFLLLSLLFLMNKVLVSADYYWVNGSGNWNDIVHWATTSGGNVYHLTPPTAFDDVYFNQNSGFVNGSSTVTLTINADCRSMNWQGGWLQNPTLAGASALRIYGSLSVHPSVTLTNSGAISFEASSGSWNIFMGHRQIANTVSFKGNGGTWTLQDSLATTSNISHEYGTINTSGHTVRCAEWGTYFGNQQRTVNWGNSTVRIYNRIYVNVNGLNWNHQTSTFNFHANNANIAVGSISFYNLNALPAIGTFTTPNISITNNAIFNGNAVFNGTNNNFNNISITTGKTYTFAANGNNTITGNVIQLGTPDCNFLTTIKSGTINTAATLTKASGQVTLNHIILQDINATGGANFTVNNVVDMGNNSGWTMNPAAPRDLYWVGGTGNWDNQQNWSLNSGGVGGACIPSFQDNVFFDANSGFTSGNATVTINTQAFCKSMTWSGGWQETPTINGTSPLRIYGSLTLHVDMNYSFTGGLFFEATSGIWTITMGYRQVTNLITFRGDGGTWGLQDSLATTANISHEYGTINTNDKTVRCAEWGTYFGNQIRVVNWGSSTVRIYNRIYVNTNGLTWNYSTSSFYFYSNNGNIAVGSLQFYNIYTVPTAGTFTTPNITVYNQAHFNNNATFNGTSNSIHELGISVNKTYSFSSGGTTTITGNIIQLGSPDCVNLTIIRSTTTDNATNINKTSGNITLDYIQLQDVNAIGGAIFTANNSIDVNNNTGWIINALAPRTLYWVGGTGNWNDTQHWSLTSGGAGGECIPTFQDDVFFNNLSGFTAGNATVTVNVAASCKTMSWTGSWASNPTLAGGSALNIYGGLSLHPNMNTTFSGGITFHATSGVWDIKMGDRQVGNLITFSGNGGSWSLLDSLATTGNISHQYGTITTNNHVVRCGEWGTYFGNQQRTVNWGSSTVRIYNRVYVNTNGLNWNYGTSSFYFYANNGNIAVGSLTFYNLYSVPYNGTFTTPSITVTNQAEFNNNATFNGNNNSFNHLTFTAGKVYRFSSGGNSSINGTYIGKGNPCYPIALYSTTPGQTSTLIIPIGDTLSSDFALIQDLNATGGLYYAGGNSSDYGNNSGWLFEYIPGYVFGLGDNPNMGCGAYPYLLTTINFNPIPGTTYLWGDNSTAPEFLAQDSGWYFVEVSYDANCVVKDSIYLAPSTGGGFVLVNDTSICGAAEVTLHATGDGEISWFDNAGNLLGTGNSFNAGLINSTTVFQVSAEAGEGCESELKPLTVTVNPGLNPEFELTLTSDGYICAGSSVDISAPLGYTSYLWSTGATSNSITVNQAGIYSLTVVDANGCVGGDDEIEIIADANPVASFTHNQENGYTVEFNNTSTNGTTYLWDFGGGNSSTQEHPEFTYPFDGFYPITLIVSNPCGSDTITTTIEVFKLSAENIELENSIQVYPNPFLESFQVNFDASIIKKNMNISIFNLLGQKVYTQHLTEQAANTLLIEFKNKTQGVYIIQICNEGSCMSKRLIKN